MLPPQPCVHTRVLHTRVLVPRLSERVFLLSILEARFVSKKVPKLLCQGYSQKSKKKVSGGFALVPRSVRFARFASITFLLEANRFFAAAPLAHRRHFFLVYFITFSLASVRRTLVHNALFTASPPSCCLPQAKRKIYTA